MKGITIERWYPASVGGSAAVLVWIFFQDGYVGLEMIQIFGTVLTVSSIGAGFVTTAKAILLTMGGRAVKQLKEAGYYAELVEYMIHATRWCMILAAVSLVGCFINMKPESRLCHGLFSAYSGVCIFTGASVHRAFSTFSKLIRITAREK